MNSWIEEPRVIDQQWTPVSIQQCTGGNWRQHDTDNPGFLLKLPTRLQRSHGLVVSGDPSAQVATGGSRKRQRPEAESCEASAGNGGVAALETAAPASQLLLMLPQPPQPLPAAAGGPQPRQSRQPPSTQ